MIFLASHEDLTTIYKNYKSSFWWNDKCHFEFIWRLEFLVNLLNKETKPSTIVKLHFPSIFPDNE